MRAAFIDELIKLAAKDERVWLLYADVGHGLVERFYARFPERTYNCGIREQAMVGIAAGLAREGMKPYCYAMETFLTRKAYEQIAVDVANPNLEVVLVGVGGGRLYLDDGYAHCPAEGMDIMRLLPNMHCRRPLHPKQVEDALHTAPRPLYMRVGEYD
jgi:transketolase